MYQLMKPKYGNNPDDLWETKDGVIPRPLISWVPEPGFGLFDTNIAAKRAYVVALEPEFAAHTDESIRLQFRSYAVNWKCVKVVKVDGSSTSSYAGDAKSDRAV